MESIVSKVHTELVDLATTHADAGRENVTLSLMADFQRAVFPLLDERIRIKDLEQSEELRDEMVQLLGDEHPTKPAWPYLDQLDKQDRCFAKMGCKFQLALRSTSRHQTISARLSTTRRKQLRAQRSWKKSLE